MIKIMSKVISKILYFVIFITSLVLFIYLLLLHGITIDHLTMPNANIKKLYIKLDKKFILKANYLQINKNYKNNTIESQIVFIKKYLKYFKLLFQEVDIKKIKYENNEISLRYTNKLFLLKTEQLYFASKIFLLNKNLIVLNIKKLNFKKYKISFTGLMKYNLTNKKIDYDGTFYTHNINGNLKLTLQNNVLQYYIYNTTSDNISYFMDFLNQKIKINKIISNWIYKYIIAKNYNLLYLAGKINIKTGNYYPKKIEAEVIAKNATVLFHPKLPKVNINKIIIILKNDTLSFILNKPIYKKIKLNNSYVKIHNLLTKNSYINIIIKTKHKFNNVIKNILKQYKISLPIKQLDGTTNATLKLHIHFVPYKINITGNFTTKNSNFQLNRINFFIKNANIKLNNNIITIHNTNILYRKMFDINTSGKIYTKKNIYKGKILFNKLLLNFNKKILLNGANIKSNIFINFANKHVKLNLFDADLFFNKNINKFIFNDINKIYPFSPILKKYNLKEGSILLTTKDFKIFNLAINNILNNQNILFYKSKPLKNLSIKAKISKKNIFFYNSLMKIKIDKNIEIKTKDISYNLKDENISKNIKITKSIILNALNSTIYFPKNITIKTNSFSFFKNRNKTIFSSIYKTNKLFYFKDKNSKNIITNFISGNYADSLIGYDLFYGGKLKVKIIWKNNDFKGYCKILNSAIKSSKKNMQNFKIDKGSFYFDLKNSILTFKNIILINNFSTLEGGGYVNLKTHTINLKFHISILKNLGKTVKSIPFLGYILLGKDGKFGSQVTITGDFKNPKIKTYFAKSVIISPANIIFRTIKIPFQLLLH